MLLKSLEVIMHHIKKFQIISTILVAKILKECKNKWKNKKMDLLNKVLVQIIRWNTKEVLVCKIISIVIKRINNSKYNNRL